MLGLQQEVNKMDNDNLKAGVAVIALNVIILVILQAIIINLDLFLPIALNMPTTVILSLVVGGVIGAIEVYVFLVWCYR